jgi:signal transduction histidine kinase/ActR/RegA family two-component response regulator
MKRAAAVRATNRRALQAFTAVLAGLVIAVAIALAVAQRERLEGDEIEYLRTEMLLLGQLATDALLRSDYDAVDGLTRRWFASHDDLYSIQAVMPNGFVISDQRRDTPPRAPMAVSHAVEFDGRPLLSLNTVGDLAEKQRAFVAVLAKIAAFTLAMIVLLSWALWSTLKRTALRPLEDEIERRQDKERQLLQRTDELVLARDEAERASRAKSQFLSSMSHELRTPLNAILGLAQILRLRGDAATGAQREQHLANIETAGWHLLELINEVLDLSRIEAGKINVRREPVPLHRLCGECVQLIEPLTHAAGIAVIDRSAEGASLAALCDRTRLNQVLMNLLSNAVKYNRRGGSITLTLQAIDEAWVELAIEDTGPGFTREQLSRLFEPFNRLGAETSAIEGTGIGLVVTKRLTELMGGRLDLTTTEGVGSRFTVRLQRAPDTGAASPALRAPVRDASNAPRTRLRKILYVEDNAANVSVVRSALELRDGVQLLEAPDGPVGLDLAFTQRPDLILIDITLPGIDGYEVCRRLRARADSATTPIIALSARAMQADIDKGKQAGFDAYLTKPVEMTVLLAHVDELLAAPHAVS